MTTSYSSHRKEEEKGRVRFKKQIEVVITDLETVISELDTVVSELKGVLCQIETVSSHLDGVFVSGKVSPQFEVPLRETVLSPVPQSNPLSPEGSPETSAKRRLESLISGAYEHGAIETPKHHWKSPGLQLSHTSPKLKNGTSRWFTDGEASFGSLSDVPSSVGSTFSDILRNAGHIGSRESLASGSVYFSPDKSQGDKFQNSPSRSRHTSGGSDDDFQANYNRDINTWTTYAMVHMDSASLASTSDCWDSETESLPNHYQPSRDVGINLPPGDSSHLRDVNNHLHFGE
ncbi:uncharacterized protein [Amphiura filiformis]|uniref:uncharacterized protein n=1 Tax=Amphiura filiformis TaxID=82378 RepID=UPI003B2123C3